MKYLTRALNLWRIMRRPTVYEKGILLHLDTDPRTRKAVEDFHDGNVAIIVTGPDCDH